jgi:hypothetical protein
MGREFNPETQRRGPFLIAETRDLDQNLAYAKERRLVEEVKASLERGRKVQDMRNCGLSKHAGRSVWGLQHAVY